MMKKVKSFNIGDKVFAKVKGYPAWPAKIVGANGKKYEVTFYGTMETGSIKVEDLFYYLKHKDQFYRNLKRKDYLEAVEQIEAEIKETGTDGNNGDETDTPIINDTPEKRGKKRKNESIGEEIQVKKINKRTTSDDMNESQEQEDKIDENTIDQVEDARSSSQSVTRSGRIVKVKKFSDDEDDDNTRKNTKIRKLSIPQEQQYTEDENYEYDDIKERDVKEISEQGNTQESQPELNKDEKSVNEIKIEETISSSKEIIEKESNTTEKEDEEETTDVNIVSTDYLEVVIAYAEQVKSKASTYKKKSVEPREIQDNEVLIAKLPSEKKIGIKYNRNAPICDNEYEKAIFESQEAERVLSLKDKIENGTIILENEKDQFVMNIQIDEDEIQQKHELKLLEHRKIKLKYLKNEANLVDYDCKIKNCLGLDKADPKKAYEYMDLIMGLDINPLMLKKHPNIVDVMKRLRRYIGNVKEWKLAGDSLETFEADAERIRQKAEEVFIKFLSLFNASDNASFWDVFNSAVEKFGEETKDMNESELFALCAEPNSRQAFFDFYDDKKESEKTRKEKEEAEQKEKENSSNAANTEQIIENQQNNVETP